MRWVVLCLLAGCYQVPVYRVQRTARVPHAAAPLRTGEPLAGPAELSVGASSIGDVRAPRLVDRDASIEGPEQQYRAELRFRIFRAEIAPIYEYAAGSSMRALDATQAPVDEGDTFGVGGAIRYSIDAGQLASGLSFGLGLEALSWEIPYVEYRTCVEACEGVDTMQILHGREHVGTLGLGFTPTYRHGPIAVFAGAYMRQHPTIVRKGTELYEQDRDKDVDGGNENWLVHAGLEWRLPHVSLLAHIQQNITRDPVWYGPSFGFAIAARLPEFSWPRSTPPAAPGSPGRPDHPLAGDGQAQPW